MSYVPVLLETGRLLLVEGISNENSLSLLRKLPSQRVGVKVYPRRERLNAARRHMHKRSRAPHARVGF